MSPTDFDPAHDFVHTPDPGRERWRESYYFQFVDFKQGIGSYHGPGYRPQLSPYLNLIRNANVPGRNTVLTATSAVASFLWVISVLPEKCHFTRFVV